MILRLDPVSEVPIYVQLRNEIVLAIGRGELAQGAPLPSIRQLAQDAGVNSMTVAKAYTALKNEGYIEIDRRSGARVSPAAGLSGDFRRRMEDELALLAAACAARGAGREDFLRLCAEGFAALGRGAAGEAGS